MSERVRLAGLIPQGFQTITLSNSTAVGLNSTMVLATTLDISVETTNARYRTDGTDPTLTTGVVLVSGVTYRLEGFNGSADFKFQRDTTGSSKLSIMGYRHPGDPTT
jgi:hypothetical protein